jgi:hypothetical protein
VLRALPQMDDAGVLKILQRRATGEGPLLSVGELLGDTLSEEQFKAVAEMLCVRSAVFEIRSRGVTDLGVRHDITAIVDRSGDNPRILYWYQSE